MVNTKIRLIILFAARDAEALYCKQKQDWELTVAQIMISLLQEVIPGETRWKGYRIFLYYFLQMQVYNYGKIIFKKVKNYSEIQFLKYF